MALNTPPGDPRQRIIDRARQGRELLAQQEAARQSQATQARRAVFDEAKPSFVGPPQALAAPAAPPAAAAAPATSPVVAPRPVASQLAGTGPSQRGGLRRPAPAGAPSTPTTTGPAPARPGDPNTFTGRNGVVRTLDANGAPTGAGSNATGSVSYVGGAPVLAGGGFAAAAPGAARAQPTAQPVATAAPVLARPAGAREGSAFPGVPDDELLRRAENRLGGNRFLTGSTSERRAQAAGNAQAAAALQGAAGARGQQRLLEQQGAQALDVASLQGANQLAAVETAAGGRLAQTDLAGQYQLAALSRPQPPQLVTGADGSLAAISLNGGVPSLTPVQGPDGQPFRSAAPQQNTTALLNAYSREAASVNQILDPVARAAAQAQLDAKPMYAQLQGQGAGGAAAPQVGAVKDGFRFKGGDPADQANWEKI